MLASVVYVVLVLALFTSLGAPPDRGRATPLRARAAVLPAALAGLRRLQDLHERGRLRGACSNPPQDR